MTQLKFLSSGTAMLLVMTGMAAADVTGAEVWENWKSAAEGMGQILTPGSETQDGNTLTISDLRVTMDAPDMTVSGTIDLIEFTELGDGTVSITMSPAYDMQMALAPEEGEKVNLTMAIGQPDMTIIASGGDGTVTYDLSGPEISIAVTGLTVNGEAMDMGANILARDISGAYVMTEDGDMDVVSSELTVASMTVDVDANEPGGDGTFAFDASFADLVVASDGNLVMLGSFDDLPALLAAGYAAVGEFSHGAASYAVNFQDGSEAFKLDATADAGNVAFSLDAEHIGYEVGNSGLAFTMSGSDIPLPEIAASFAEFGFAFLMPLAKSDDPQDFGMNVTLDGLQVSDMIWGLADPTGALSHDPATLIVDVTGSANWLIDIMDPEAAAMMGEAIPAALHALDLNDLTLAVAGAILTGTGGFTFDNDNLTTFNGLPAPTGAIDLKLVGGNALLDTLVSMGLVPEDQAMGARMMMGLFARPGEGEDTLTSKIEVDGATGAISANGQRLQ